MSEDRLKEIRHRLDQMSKGLLGELTLADARWLISEFERRGREVELAEARCPPDYKMLVEEQEATIATLREALISRRVLGTPEDPCFQYCQAHWQPEHTPDCQSMRKALATAQKE